MNPLKDLEIGEIHFQELDFQNFLLAHTVHVEMRRYELSFPCSLSVFLTRFRKDWRLTFDFDV